MPVFLLKSYLSLLMIVMALVALFTMLEISGRSENKFEPAKLRNIHRLNGILFILFFIAISWICLVFIVRTKTELSPRATFHSVFALAVILLILIKILFIRIYRKFYGKVQIIGISVVLLTFGTVAMSSGYYLLATKFGAELAVQAPGGKKLQDLTDHNIILKMDHESITRGKGLYEEKCSFCHDAYSLNPGVGPGHRGIMKNRLLPVSKRPSTPENIAGQLRLPFRDMPSFSYLKDHEIEDLIAFLNTL